MFSEDFRSSITREAKVLSSGRNAPGFEPRASTGQGQAYVVARLTPSFADSFSHHWAILSRWDGSVGIAATGYHPPGWTLLTEELLQPAISVATELVRALGGTGRMHLVIEAAAPNPPKHVLEAGGLIAPRPITRVLEADGPSEGDMTYLLNELRRGAGEDVWLDG